MAVSTWHGPCRYQGMGGTSLGILFVRHGASKSFPLAMFRPTVRVRVKVSGRGRARGRGRGRVMGKVTLTLKAHQCRR